ncbi:hypothetical protein BH11ARM2_BH11ARM2_31170 [soil metagenome]
MGMSYTVEAIIAEEGKVHVEVPEGKPGDPVELKITRRARRFTPEEAEAYLAGSVKGDFDLRGPILTEEEWGSLY